MNRVLIVDDETIVRVTLRSLIDWEANGYTIIKDCMSGQQALDYLKETPVDLLITDMKMPGMDGLELMEAVSREGKTPVTLVLSGYNEFELVREAFRKGAYDYLLKSDLNARSLAAMLKKLNQDIFKGGRPEKYSLESKRIQLPKDGQYSIVLFEIRDFKRQTARFGEDLDERLEKPMLELARQIPRVGAKGGIVKAYPSQLLLYYKVTDEIQYPAAVQALVRQIQAVWRDYMNLEVLAGISVPVSGSQIDEALGQDIRLLKWSALYGAYGVSTFGDFESRIQVMDEEKDRCISLLTALFSGDQVGAETEKQDFLTKLEKLSLEEAKERCLHLVCQLADKFREYELDFSALFPEEVNYFEKIGRLGSIGELNLWLNNYIRWVSHHLEMARENKQADVIERAQRFLADNFANQELTLRVAADYVGLNEKYFSSKFTKETGMTFSVYLTRLRLQKAQQLMDTTDLKVYEISDRVGYNSVEHFNRTFKKNLGISPSEYRKSGKKR